MENIVSWSKKEREEMRSNKSLGIITFGESRKVKMVEVDISFNKKCGDNLYKYGLMELRKDREAVISYMVRLAIDRMVKTKKGDK
jgi:hypothetical protein